MCKVMMIAGIKNEHLPKVQKLAKAAAKNMSIVEDDGVGYAAITKEGMIYGEKWRNKDDAFNIHAQPKNDPVVDFMHSLLGNMGEWGSNITTSKVYDSFGERTTKSVDTTVGLIIHARKASFQSAKTIENVHPFAMINIENQPDTALIHNGVIMNHEKLTKTMSSCDSEVILHEYLANMMYHNPWGMEQLAKTLIGEYACGVLSSMTDSDGTQIPVLDVFKSGKDLHCGYVPELETMVFCTSEHTLNQSCSDAGLTVKNVVKVKDGYLIRLNAVTGQRVDDLISFTTSSKHYNDYTKNHTHSMVRASDMGPYKMKAVGPGFEKADDITETSDDTIESAKKHFERRHPSLFTQSYIEVKGNLATNEAALFSELSLGNDTNHKALHLVAVALASVNAKG